MARKPFNETTENLDKLKKIAELSNTLEKYVYLREDENGRYIEYAFIDGAPDNNRCLSWYDKLQPNALKRNKHDISKWRLREVDKIYELTMLTCTGSCKVGEPKKDCLFAEHWTIDEPIKCACWMLNPVYNVINPHITFY